MTAFAALSPAAAVTRGMMLALLLTSGCFSLGDGRDPALDEIYFPVGLALTPNGSRLYVANSDFDLQYNAGTLLVLDAAAVKRLRPTACTVDADCGNDRVCDNRGGAPTFFCQEPDGDPCGELGMKSAADRQLEPGLCNPVDLRSGEGAAILLDAVSISAFATDVIYRQNPRGRGARLFIPSRGDATLHWADVESEPDDSDFLERDSRGAARYIDCGQGSGHKCDSAHRRGDDESEFSPEGERVPIEPFAVAATMDGKAIVTTHQTTGELALFVNDWCKPRRGPELKYVLSGLPTRPVAIAPVPVPALVRARAPEDDPCGGDDDDDQDPPTPSDYQPGFLVGYRSSARLDLVRYFDADTAGPAGPLLEATETTPVSVVGGIDARGLGIDDSARVACEEDCAPGRLDCLRNCGGVGLGVYVANRFPAALLVGETAPGLGEFPRSDVPNLSRAEALRGSPSRVVVGEVRVDADGNTSPRIFVISFDTRLIYIYDPARSAIEARIVTGRGPHALAIDGKNGVGYVAHYTDSYIGVIDLDRSSRHYGEIILTLGKPQAPQAAK